MLQSHEKKQGGLLRASKQHLLPTRRISDSNESLDQYFFDQLKEMYFHQRPIVRVLTQSQGMREQQAL